jgi:hypothetical protein
MSKMYTGRDGRMLLGTADLGKVTNWTLQADLETLETTSLGDSQRNYTPGVQAFSGSATLLYYNDGTKNDASTLLGEVVKTTGVTTPVTLTLRLTDGTNNKDVSFSAYVTSASIGASVGEVSSAQISFQATGALTNATL